MEGRFVYGQEVIFGTRSECDADDWTCTECNIINKSQQFLIFTIPAFTCTSCKKPFAGDFDFCLASVMANGLPLVDKVLCEKDGEGNCIAYAIVQSIGIIHRIHIALASNNGKLDIGLAKMPVEREVLIDAYSKKFPVEVGQVGGVHKLIHMCQDVVEHGVELKDKWWKRFFPSKYFNAVSKVAAIPCDDFEEVCRQIADGNPLIAVLMVGEKWENLKFCQFYKPISAVERALAGKFNINFVDHAIVLIGACSLGGHRAYYGLNSAGSLFCKQVGLNEDWKALSAAPGGFGKIKADSDFLINFLKLTRSGEDETHPVLKHEDETPVLSRENVAIVRGGEWSQRRKALINMMWALEYDPDIFSTYKETGDATDRTQGHKPKVKSTRQFGKYERANMKNGTNGVDGPVPISVFLVASVLKENSQKLLQEARGIDDIITILNNVKGNLDAKKACAVALKLHVKYLRKMQGKKP